MKKIIGYGGVFLFLFSNAFGQMEIVSSMELEKGVSPISLEANYKNYNSKKDKKNEAFLFINSNIENLKKINLDDEFGFFQGAAGFNYLTLNKNNYAGGSLNLYHLNDDVIYGLNFSGYEKNSIYVDLMYQVTAKNVGKFLFSPYYSRFDKENFGGFYTELGGNIYEDDVYSVDYKIGVNSYKNFGKLNDESDDKKKKVVDSNIEISFSQNPYLDNFDEVILKTEEKVIYYHSFKDKNLDKENVGISFEVSCDIKNLNIYAKDEYVTGKTNTNIVTAGFKYRL